MKRADFLAMLDIGITVKKLREKKGLSQEELAKDICDRTNITKLENGHSKIPSLSFIFHV
jgi:transcriptional regulator with XRE-family HTH domain